MDAALSNFSADAWQDLTAAVIDPDHGFHWPVLSTIDQTGGPRARVVVLRAADRAHWTLQCFTDRRAPKVREIENDARVSWTFFDRARNAQLRAEGRMRVHGRGAIVETAWQRLPIWSRAAYACDRGPSTARGLEPSAPRFAEAEPSAAEVEVGRASFVVCVCQVDELDVLRLGPRLQHRRARFRRDESGECVGSWLQP